MDQNTKSQNKNSGGEGFFQKNQNYIIAGIIVVLLIIYFATQKPNNADQAQNTDDTEQVADNTDSTNEGDTNSNNEQSENQNQNTPTPAPQAPPPAGGSAPTPTTPNPTPAANQNNNVVDGDVSVPGRLKVSDNTSKGNYMVESSQGKIYVSTKRDFTPWVDKDVTLQANGNINQFTFLGFKEATTPGTVAANPQPAPSPTPDLGGAPDSENRGNVSFSGKLDTSDNTAKGNYVVMSGQNKVYIQTARDYSAWVGKDVNAKANGSINQFSGLILSEKK